MYPNGLTQWVNPWWVAGCEPSETYAPHQNAALVGEFEASETHASHQNTALVGVYEASETYAPLQNTALVKRLRRIRHKFDYDHQVNK